MTIVVAFLQQLKNVNWERIKEAPSNLFQLKMKSDKEKYGGKITRNINFFV